RFKEGTHAFADGVQTTLEIAYPVPMLREIHLQRCDGPVANLLAPADPQLLEGEGAITVRVANTRHAQLGDSVRCWLHYPYGCLALLTLAVAHRPEPAYHELLFNKRALLSLESRAILARAIHQGHGADAMVAALLEPRDQAMAQGELWFGCPERELAAQLLAW